MTTQDVHVPWLQLLALGFEPPRSGAGETLAGAITQATAAFEQHLLLSPHVRDFLAELPKGSGTDCPDSPIDELVRYVANQKGTIDKSDPWLTLRFLSKYVRPAVAYERRLALEAATDFQELTEVELCLFHAGIMVAEATDALWQRWFEAVAAPYQALDEAGRQRYVGRLKEVLPAYDYTAFDYDEEKGCLNRRTWAQAFPKEIENIIFALDPLCDPYVFPFDAYFRALRAAYQCTDVDQLEKMWRQVDEAWIDIPRTQDVMPVHGMESHYEHPCCVSPEFRLDVRTAKGRELIDKRRQATLDHAAAFGLSNDLVSQAVGRLNRMDIGIFVSACRAGTLLNFRYSGQAVPNRQEVLLRGGRIFMDASAPARETKRYIEKIERHCAPATARMLVPLMTADALLAHTATHECAHPVGRTPESDKALGSSLTLCEEAKATLLGILADEHHDPSPEHRLELITATIGRILRFMHRDELENQTLAPYVRENLAAATMLFDAGVMRLGPEGLVVHRSVAEREVWFSALRAFNRIVLAAYQAHDPTMLDRVTPRYFNREHPQVAALIAWVNRW